MIVLGLGLLALVLLWWIGKTGQRLHPALTARVLSRIAAYALFAAGLVFALRGRIDVALLLGAGGLWFHDGKAGLKDRVMGLLGRRSRRSIQYRSASVELEIGPDGSPGEGWVLAGPWAGRRLAEVPPEALGELHAICRGADPEGARLLETYLDRRHPGWRVDAQGDPDPRAGRPLHPGAMTEEQAYQILGLERGASLQEIRTAHRALMKRLHPDQGGTAEGAARINAARDRLTNRHR